MSTCSLASLELIQDLAPDRIDRGVGSLSRAAPNWQRGSAFSSHDDDADLSWKREEKEKHVTSRYSSSPLLFFFAWVRNRHREMQCVFQRHNPFVASILHLNGVHLGHAETAELLNAGCKVLRWSCKAVNSRGFHWCLSAGVHFLANLSWNCHCMGIWSDLIFRSACSWGGWMSRGKKMKTRNAWQSGEPTRFSWQSFSCHLSTISSKFHCRIGICQCMTADYREDCFDVDPCSMPQALLSFNLSVRHR